MPTASDHQELEHSRRHAPPEATLVGPADPDEVAPVTVAVRRRPDASPLPGHDHWAATPPAERRYISDEEFAARHGAAANDLDAIARFAREHGLDVRESDAAQRIVILAGPVAALNEAFGVEMRTYERPGLEPRRAGRAGGRGRGRGRRSHREREVYRSYEGVLRVPGEIAPIVEGVFGLDTRRMARRALPLPPMPVITPLTPPQVAGLYDFPAPSPRTGRETIGLLEFSDPVVGTCGYETGDIDAYFTTSQGIGPGYAVPAHSDIGVNGATNAPGGPDDAEVTLDIEVAGAIAQGARIAVYFTTWDENGWVLALKRAVHPHPGEHRPSVLSISWDWAEYDALGNLSWTPAAMAAVSAAFQEAAMFGVTVLVASGDDGSDCQVGDGRAHVYYPESDPWGTSCGGTTIGNVSGSAFTEITWNDSGITGGGISDVFSVPPWQRHAQVPASVNPGHHRGRGVPDIAGYANGYQIVLGGSSSGPWWGTSETAPLYAALVAIINGELDGRVGFLNPTLYEHSASAIFRDIDDGRSNAAGGAPGDIAGPGWDACTGLGSIRGRKLLEFLRRRREPEEARNGHRFTGKVAALVFDSFGDFDGFMLEDGEGGEHRFRSREHEVEKLVDRALEERTVTTILIEHDRPERPRAILFRGR
ncbi:MAG TPA: S53 family peptidase [Solirubrobacteraceae bacterium]|nr:S53 family peptidase [Solirubrobacteraceae bacterium]